MDESLNEETLNPPDDFDLAFDAAMGLTDSASAEDLGTKDAPEVVDPETPDVVVPDPEAAKPEPEAPKPEPEAVKPEPVEPKVVPIRKPAEPDPAALKAEEDAKAAAQAVADAAKAQEAFTAEEQATLTQVQTDFPDVAKLLQAVERTTIARVQNAYEARLKDLEAKISQQMAPALQVSQQYAKDAHTSEILKGHADAFDVLPKVEAWVDTQPSFLKTAYNAVLDNGSAAQIVELFNLYKGSVTAPAAPTPKEDPQQKAAKEKKLNAQEGVRGRHTSGRAAVDPDDFDGAFDKFAATA